MAHPVDIALRGIPASSAFERFIGEEARRLDRICGRVRSCQVVVEAQQREQPKGAQVAVRLIITLPGTEVVVNREHGSDVYVAARDAFAAAARQLEDQMRRRDIEPAPRDETPKSRR